MDNLAKELNRSHSLQVQNFSHAVCGTLTHSKSMRFYHLSMWTIPVNHLPFGLSSSCCSRWLRRKKHPMLRDLRRNQQLHYCPKPWWGGGGACEQHGKWQVATPLCVEGRQMTSHYFLKLSIRNYLCSEILPRAAKHNVPFWWWFNVNESFAYSICHSKVGKFFAFTLRFQAHEWSYRGWCWFRFKIYLLLS